MTQYKDIPQPTDQRNVSQNDLLNNGRYMLDVSNPANIVGIIPVDHQASSDNGANPTDGFHKQMSWVNRATPANLTNAVNGQASSSILYPKADGQGMSQARFFTTGNKDFPVTFLRAAAQFSGSTGAVNGNGFNMNAATHTGTGKFTINFIDAMPTNNYIYMISLEQPTSGSADISTGEVVSRSLGSMNIEFRGRSGGGNLYFDPVTFTVMVIGFF